MKQPSKSEHIAQCRGHIPFERSCITVLSQGLTMQGMTRGRKIMHLLWGYLAENILDAAEGDGQEWPKGDRRRHSDERQMVGARMECFKAHHTSFQEGRYHNAIIPPWPFCHNVSGRYDTAKAVFIAQRHSPLQIRICGSSLASLWIIKCHDVKGWANHSVTMADNVSLGWANQWGIFCLTLNCKYFHL